MLCCVLLFMFCYWVYEGGMCVPHGGAPVLVAPPAVEAGHGPRLLPRVPTVSPDDAFAGQSVRASQVDPLLAELDAARTARSQLETALRLEQRRAHEWHAQAQASAAAAAGLPGTPGVGGFAGAAGGSPGPFGVAPGPVGVSPGRLGAAADKKRDETAGQLGAYDPESAVLQVRLPSGAGAGGAGGAQAARWTRDTRANPACPARCAFLRGAWPARV